MALKKEKQGNLLNKFDEVRIVEQNMPTTLSVVVVQDEGYWIAQCLEYNMVAQAKELKNLPENFFFMLSSHVEVRARAGQEPFVGIPKAPEKYWEIFEEGLNLDVNPQVGFQASLQASGRNIAIPHLEARIA